MHYAAGFYGSCFSRVHLHVGVIDAEGAVVPVYDDQGTTVQEIDQALADEATALVAGLRSSAGGQAQLMNAFGLNLAGPGEVLLLTTQEQLPDSTAQRSYEALSVEELKQKGDGKWVRMKGPTSSDEEDLSGEIDVLRIWQPHPKLSSLADSSFRPVLDICEELLLLTRAVRATATSRLAGAGILFVSNALDYPDDDTAADGTEEQDPFTRDLIMTMTTPIGDPGSASAVVPLVIRGDGKPDDLIKHWEFTRSFDALPSMALRREAVERLAQGIDLPVEVVTGHRQTTFANAASIDESTFKVHIKPKLELLVDALTVGYLRAHLLNATAPDQVTRRAQIARLAVRYDAVELIAEADMGAAANQAHDRWTISDAAQRRANGFSEADKPDAAEIERRVAIHQAIQVRSSPTQPPLPTPADIPVESPAGLVDRVHAATDYAVERAIDRAGARLRAKVNGKGGLKGLVAGLPLNTVAATLGPATVSSLIPAAELFEGEFVALGRLVGEWAANEGHPDPGGVTLRVLTLAEEMAERRLYSREASIGRTVIAQALG